MRPARRAGCTVLLLAALAATGPARAESLQEAWQLALEHDQILAAKASGVEAARAGEKAATAARWPSLRGSAGYTLFDTAPAFDLATQEFAFRSAPIFDDDDYLMGSVQLSVPLYAGGQISAGIDAARYALAGAEADERSTLAAVKLDVAHAFVDVLRTRRALRTAESSVTSLTAHVNDVQQMAEQELVPTSDLLSARVALANATQARVRADNALQIAHAAYNRRIGRPLDQVPELDPVLPVDPELASLPPLPSLVERAVASRTELAQLAAQADTLESQSRVERAALRPQLALTGGYSYLENEFLDREDFSMVGIGVQWRMFDGGQVRQRAAAMSSAGRAARHQLDDLRSLIELQVREAWLNIGAARARVSASREAVSQAEENLRMTRELYGADLGSNTQVLDADTLRVAAANNYDDAMLDESLALMQLAHAIGAL